MSSAEFWYPSDLFDSAATDRDWSCVVVRPRWEKKFSRLLVAWRLPHFLALFERRTVSGGKIRYSRLPLFPGYVFVLGRQTRRRFAESDCVVRVILPDGDPARLGLAKDIQAVQTLLASGEPVMPQIQLTPGQRVRVLAGALEGMVGEFVRFGGQGQLTIRINMLGVGAAVNLPPEIPVEPEDGGRKR